MESQPVLSVFTETGGRVINATGTQVIYEPDTPANNIYYIHRGQVRVYIVAANGLTRLMAILGPGEWFGTGALAGAETCGARAIAYPATVITEVGAQRLASALVNNPAQMLELNRQLAERLMSAYQESSRLVFEDCNQRLVHALLRFSNSAASTPREDGVVLRITHDQLAQAVGVARETVSLALTQLRQRNLLRTGRNQLVFNPEALRKFSCELASKSAAAEQVQEVA